MRSPPLLKYFPYYQHTTVVCGVGGLNKYQGRGADSLQRPLLRRSRFRQQLRPGVRLLDKVRQTNTMLVGVEKEREHPCPSRSLHWALSVRSNERSIAMSTRHLFVLVG